MRSGSRRVLAAAPRLVVLGALAVTTGGCRGATGEIQEARRSTAATQARAERPSFDGAAAMKLLKRQCEPGPRVPGTPAHRAIRDWMLAEMGRYADKVIRQDFTYRGLPMTNVVGVFSASAPRRVVICAHWDSRPTADQEILRAKRRLPVMGANDGASGVAVILEIARILKKQPPAVGVVLALFDGEDYGDFERDEGVFLGSRHFAANLKDVGKLEYGILLDMVGDKDLTIYREGISEQEAPHINDLVFGVAAQLGFGKILVNSVRHTVTDDHVSLIRAGVPCIDLIDFDYAAWHTLDDTPDKCSAESLRVVGEVIAEVIYRERVR